MSRCEGPGCPHPEHYSPDTMPAWQWQRLPSHAGDRLAEQHAAEQVAARARLVELFGGALR